MDKLRALQYFVAAAEEGSFAGAGRRLEVSVPAVHKLVTALEASLGARLFERTVQGLTLTASGHEYLESCRPLLADLAAIDETVSRAAQRPTGTLVIGAHPQAANHILVPALPRFHTRYPEIQIDVRVVNKPTDVDAAMADVFLLMGWPEADDLVHKCLGHARSLIVAAPEYWSAHGIPQHPSDLQRHVCLLMRNPGGTLIDLWEFERGEEKVAVNVNGWLSSNGRDVVLDAVLAGEGVGRFTQVTTRAFLQAGRLVPVLIDWQVLGAPPVNLLYRPGQRRTPRVRLFIDYITAVFEEPEADGGGTRPATSERPHWHRRGHGRASSLRRGTRRTPT